LALKHNQTVNHFNNNHHLTSKYGLTRRLRTLPLGHGIDSHRFYPKCFDLADQVDFENFVENFKISFSESVAKRFLIDKKRYHKLETKIRIAYEVLKRRVLGFGALLQSVNQGQFPVITPE
jgi:tubulin monoglycylase TTLL3/8